MPGVAMGEAGAEGTVEAWAWPGAMASKTESAQSPGPRTDRSGTGWEAGKHAPTKGVGPAGTPAWKATQQGDEWSRFIIGGRSPYALLANVHKHSGFPDGGQGGERRVSRQSRNVPFPAK